MAELSLNLPVVGEKDTTAEPKVTTALTEIQTQINGKIAAVNLEAGAVTEPKIETGLREKLGLSRGKSIIATEQERTNVAYGKLGTPDEVTVTMPENGLIAVFYQAEWKGGVEGNPRAAIFVGANQLVIDGAGAGALTQAARTTGVAQFGFLSTHAGGLIGGQGNTGEQLTTGQVIGGSTGAQKAFIELGGNVTELTGAVQGGPCYIFAAVGTYVISVQFKSAAGNVAVKNRKLWVEAKAF